MIDVKELIKTILSDSKLNSDGSKVYRDEPIIKTASQMANYLPPKYREMRAVAKQSGAYMLTDTRIFVQQGQLMADFEDDFDYHGEFIRYFPTYQSMNDLQLRGYFSWRTKLRKGEIEKAPTSFAFVYIYELLNQIGVDSAQDGFEALRRFWADYGGMEPAINRYMETWLRDYVVYYNLDLSLLANFAGNAFDSALAQLMNPSECSDDELFAALSALSSYNLENAKFYKENADDVRHIACAVFREMTDYFAKNRKYSLCENYFGRVFDAPYYMFQSAVFYDENKRDSFEYRVNEILSFTCTQGNWRSTRFIGKREKNRELGAMMKAIDCVARQKYAYPHEIKPPKATKILLKIIEKTIDDFLEEKKKNERPIIEIDVTKLHEIRLDSAETRDKLIVDDDEAEEPAEMVAEPQNETSLNSAEYSVMRCLLYGGDYSSAARDGELLLSVAVDSINEKLFDILGDTAVEFVGDKPEIIEDYADELKAIIKE